MVNVVLDDSSPGSVAVMVTLLTPVLPGVPWITRVAELKVSPLAGLMLAV